jgi:adenine-specific DNA glycosylase
LIADQKAELERLKQQLSSQAPAVPAETTDDAEKQAKEQEEQEAKLRMLKTKEEELLLREKEIEQLRVQLENTPAIVIQPDEEQENKAEILAQKERSLQEKEAQLEEQKRLMEEKVPGIDQVALQLEALKAEVIKHIW